MAAIVAPDTRNWRQRRCYTYVCNLYRPRLLSASADDLESKDAGVNYEAAYTSVYGLYKSTPEFDVSGLVGRGKEINLVTSDEWRFVSSQPIADQWVIQMTASDPRYPPHPNIGRLWLVHDNAQTIASQGGRKANEVMVYAILSNVPGLSALVEGLD